jgi:hypothetical protein
MTENPSPAPCELQQDSISLDSLRDNFVHAGASQQEAVCREGGLWKDRVAENSRKLIGRIHKMFGFVDVMTATPSQPGHDSVPFPVNDVAEEFAARSRSRSRSPRRSPLTTHQVLQAAVLSDQVADDYSDRAMSNQCIALVDQESLGGSIATVGEVHGSLGDAFAPPLFKQTNGQVRFMLSGGYYEPMKRQWKGPNILNLKYNDDVLWAGVKLGRRGGQSTVKEYFHGTFLGWACSEWANVI